MAGADPFLERREEGSLSKREITRLLDVSLGFVASQGEMK
jgi:hypothetical protein